jgi:predicted naringenin-chalcone synthase
VADQAFAEEYMRRHYGDRLNARSKGLLRTIFSHPSIQKRHFAFDDPDEIARETKDERIARFTRWAVELSAQAIGKALAEAGLGAADVEGLVVNTCTGYICPGISTYLIERLGLPRTVKAYDLVGSGCGGAVPNLEVAESVLNRNGSGRGAVVSVSVEICSATFQMDNDLSLILSNALFGDGAAAAVLWNRPEGYELTASASRYVPEQRDTIRYVHKNGELHNQLSLRLPDLVNKAAKQVVDDLLARQKLAKADVRHWAVHTGGEKIVNAIRDEIGLAEEQMAATRSVLTEYGNMSSPTVWFVLKELEQRGIAPGDRIMLLAFGAGLSAHGYLVKKR